MDILETPYHQQKFQTEIQHALTNATRQCGWKKRARKKTLKPQDFGRLMQNDNLIYRTQDLQKKCNHVAICSNSKINDFCGSKRPVEPQKPLIFKFAKLQIAKEIEK